VSHRESEEPRTTRRWQAPKGWAQPPRQPPRTFGSFASRHLALMRDLREVSPRWLRCVAHHLEDAVAFFGASQPLEAVRVSDVEDWAAHLLVRSNGRGGSLSANTVNHYLNSLSALFQRARAKGLVPENPVGLLRRRPSRTPGELPWLEPPEVRAVLAFARSYVPTRPDLAILWVAKSSSQCRNGLTEGSRDACGRAAGGIIDTGDEPKTSQIAGLETSTARLALSRNAGRRLTPWQGNNTFIEKYSQVKVL